MGLIAKVMSNEKMPDSDLRKLYSLFPIPAGYTVEFRRNLKDPATLNFIPTNIVDPTTVIPLDNCGNVYILDDGKTVSTFNPAPVGSSVTVIGAKSSTISLHADHIHLQAGLTADTSRDPDTYDSLMSVLNELAPASLYEFAGDWNHLIALAISNNSGPNAFDQLPIPLPGVLADEAAVSRWRNRANDALLNHKPYYALNLDGFTAYITTPGSRDQERLRSDQAIIAVYNLTGKVVNELDRALKLYHLGARTIIFSQALSLTEEERTMIKSVFRDRNNEVVTFKQQGPITYQLACQGAGTVVAS